MDGVKIGGSLLPFQVSRFIMSCHVVQLTNAIMTLLIWEYIE